MKLKIQDALAGKHNEELNIACAELEGWQNVGMSDMGTGYRLRGNIPKEQERMIRSRGEANYTPDDLRGWIPEYVSPDAIEALGNVHRLEGLLPVQEVGIADKYQWLLHRFIVKNCQEQGLQGTVNQYYWHATALQRVVALLLVLKPEMFEH